MASELPEPKYDASIEFLQKWNPAGPWVLTAIDPNKKGIETVTFPALDPEACRA